MATVEVIFAPLPSHVRTARLVATAVARRSGVAESLLDEVRLAVGEACSRAVEAHQRHCPGEPVRLALTDQPGRFEIEVTDASASPEATAPTGFALAVIAGLADDVQITETEAGTSVLMSWPSAGVLTGGQQVGDLRPGGPQHLGRGRPGPANT